MKDALYQFVLAAIVPAILYFLGWAYLYFYLQLFNIDLSELSPSIETVFIYAYSPVYNFRWLLLVVFLIFVGLLVGISLLARHNNSVLNISVLARIQTHYTWMKSHWPVPGAIIPILFVLFLLPWILLPLAKSAATETARHAWRNAPPVEAVVERARREPDHGGWQWARSFQLLVGGESRDAEDDIGLTSLKLYRECWHRPDQLKRIFADANRYFLLCVSADYANRGTVYEIEKGKGIASFRNVRLHPLN